MTTIGYRYHELGEHPTAAVIAKAIRQDIRQSVVEGLLPKRWKYSVRSNRFAGGCAIDVVVLECVDAWTGVRDELCTCAESEDERRRVAVCGHEHFCPARNRLTEEASVAEMTLQRIHSAYNHDNSDTRTDYFDVRYYGDVRFESLHEASERAKEQERLQALTEAG